MSYNADRLRKEIHDTGREPFDGIRDDLARTFEAIARQSTSISAFSEAVSAQIEGIWHEIEDHGDSLMALSNRLEAVTQAMVTQGDLDDLRLEVREATSTPFDPPEAAA